MLCETCGGGGLVGANELAPRSSWTLCPACLGQYAAAHVSGQRAVLGEALPLPPDPTDPPPGVTLPAGQGGEIFYLDSLLVRQLDAWGTMSVPGNAQRVAATGPAGYTLVNGTGPILTWVAPSDGRPHSVQLNVVLHVSANETGGDINLAFTAPAGNTKTTDYIGAGKTADEYACDFPQWQQFLVAPGGTVTLAQNTALTAGASVLYAEIWAD